MTYFSSTPLSRTATPWKALRSILLPSVMTSLPSSTSLNNGESCAGGVVVASMDGKIVCANTLDERLAVAHDTNLPVIRKRLFGE